MRSYQPNRKCCRQRRRPRTRSSPPLPSSSDTVTTGRGASRGVDTAGPEGGSPAACIFRLILHFICCVGFTLLRRFLGLALFPCAVSASHSLFPRIFDASCQVDIAFYLSCWFHSTMSFPRPVVYLTTRFHKASADMTFYCFHTMLWTMKMA